MRRPRESQKAAEPGFLDDFARDLQKSAEDQRIASRRDSGPLRPYRELLSGQDAVSGRGSAFVPPGSGYSASPSPPAVGCDATFVRSPSLQNRQREDFRDVHAAKGSTRA